MASLGSVGGAGISAVMGVMFSTAVSTVAGVMFTLIVISRWRSESKKQEYGTPVTYLFQQVTGQRSAGPKQWPSLPQT
jgi:hypothetical protein